MGVKMTTIPGMPTSVNKNPLQKFFRQPAIYFMPPSGGRWWPPGAMNVPPTGEFAVYPMTSRDEVLLRTPDALLNGQGMVDVIQSCIPDIKDAWKMPATDVDAVLIAMRIASYGHQMDFESTCPHCNEEHTYALDLRSMLDQIKAPNFEETFTYEDITVKFRPQQYYGLNRNNKINFEVQKLSQSIDNMTDEDAKVNETVIQMNKLVDLNLEILAECTESISFGEETVTDRRYILEFYKNINSKMVSIVQTAYGELAAKGAIPKQKTQCAGCNEEMDMAITFDYANFFASGS
jgi:hypothetical protein